MCAYTSLASLHTRMVLHVHVFVRNFCMCIVNEVEKNYARIHEVKRNFQVLCVNIYIYMHV
jgi:hypothetical protein